MDKCDKLLEKARRSANNFSVSDVCELAECYGYYFDKAKWIAPYLQEFASKFCSISIYEFSECERKVETISS